MYTGEHAKTKANQPAFIMAGSGETVTYAELEERSNRLAHFLRGAGLNRLDHYSIFMERSRSSPTDLVTAPPSSTWMRP
jgi:long-chain acyl-CoA synthetase